MSAQPLTPEQQRIVADNVGLIYKMAQVRRVPDRCLDEAIGEGVEALIRAARGFDPSRGFKFSTYACRAILSGFARAVSGNHAKRWQRVTLSGITGDAWLSPLDQVGDDRPPDASMTTRDDLAHLARLLPLLEGRERDVLSRRFGLNGCEPQTLQMIGDDLGVTKERIRQIESRALSKLRKQMAA